MDHAKPKIGDLLMFPNIPHLCPIRVVTENDATIFFIKTGRRQETVALADLEPSGEPGIWSYIGQTLRS